MIDDIGNIRRVHARQHFRQIGDGAATQESLDRHQPHVGLRLAADGRLAGRIFPQAAPYQEVA